MVTDVMFALEMANVRVIDCLFNVDPRFAITTLKVVDPVLSTKPLKVEVIE